MQPQNLYRPLMSSSMLHNLRMPYNMIIPSAEPYSLSRIPFSTTEKLTAPRIKNKA